MRRRRLRAEHLRPVPARKPEQGCAVVTEPSSSPNISMLRRVLAWIAIPAMAFALTDGLRRFLQPLPSRCPARPRLEYRHRPITQNHAGPGSAFGTGEIVTMTNSAAASTWTQRRKPRPRTLRGLYDNGNETEPGEVARDVAYSQRLTQHVTSDEHRPGRPSVELVGNEHAIVASASGARGLPPGRSAGVVRGRRRLRCLGPSAAQAC